MIRVQYIKSGNVKGSSWCPPPALEIGDIVEVTEHNSRQYRLEYEGSTYFPLKERFIVVDGVDETVFMNP